MDPLAIFGVSVLLSFVCWAIVTGMYVWPRLRVLPATEALQPILVLHAFRFIGLAFLVPGVVSPELPAVFAAPAAYGDVVAAALAIVALVWIVRQLPGALAVVWVFNVWGAADLLYAFYQGLLGVGVEPGLLGAAFFIPTVIVPLLLITHVLVFRLLLMPSRQP